ncbi:MATE family efflux transporter [Umezawaea sp. NPDC059074]|uniref:MATE family efflux transporter n=1 Tax=Umezawaea sp. NPDC059074 TaxID=3346716 RepID=UPI003678A771
MSTATDMTSLRRISGTLLALGVPLAVGFVSQMAISFTDAALVARLGTVELTGVTLALSVFSVVMLLGLGVVTAVSPEVATAFRTGAHEEARGWYAQGSWLAAGLGLLGALVLVNTRGILVLLGQSPELAEVAGRYNTGAALGLPFFLLYVNVRSTLSSVGRPKPLTWIMLAAVPVNLVVGYLAVFGIGGVPGFGVAGAGWSSTVVRGLIIVAALAVVHRKVFPDAVRWRPDIRALGQLARVGAPIGVRILLGEGFLPILAFFMARFGAEATTAHAVALRLVTLISVVALGFSSAAATMSAWARADRSPTALRGLRSALLLVGGCYAVVLSAATAGAFGFVVDVLFGLRDVGAKSALHVLLPLVLGYFVLDTLGTMLNGYLVGMQDTLLPTVVVMVSFWVVGLGTGLLLSGPVGMGFSGLWVGMAVAALLVFVFNVARSGYHAGASSDR